MFRTTWRRHYRIRVAILRLGLLLASLAIAASAFADPVGTISTIAGTGTAGGNGDGAQATAAQLSFRPGPPSTRQAMCTSPTITTTAFGESPREPGSSPPSRDRHGWIPRRRHAGGERTAVHPDRRGRRHGGEPVHCRLQQQSDPEGHGCDRHHHDGGGSGSSGTEEMVGRQPPRS